MRQAGCRAGRRRFPVITTGKTGHVTDGLVLLAAWAEFLLLLGVLAFFVLRRGDPG